jgi:flagellin-like protein
MGANRKGITPVIGVVLLMLITTGAVAVVYTQFSSLASQGKDLDELNRKTTITMMRSEATGGHTAGDDGGYLNVTITNTGQISRNTTAFSLTAETGEDISSSECFTDEHSKIMDPADRFPDNGYECNTTIPFPGPTEKVELKVNLQGSSKSWGKTCAPRRSWSTTC